MHHPLIIIVLLVVAAAIISTVNCRFPKTVKIWKSRQQRVVVIDPTFAPFVWATKRNNGQQQQPRRPRKNAPLRTRKHPHYNPSIHTQTRNRPDHNHPTILQIVSKNALRRRMYWRPANRRIPMIAAAVMMMMMIMIPCPIPS